MRLGVNGDQGNNDASDSGAVYVFTTQWVAIGASKPTLKPPIRELLRTLVVVSPSQVTRWWWVQSYENSNAYGCQWRSKAIMMLVIPEPLMYLPRSGTNWSQQAYLKASNTDRLDKFGGAVAIDGDTVVVGARNEDSGATRVNNPTSEVRDSGAAYVFIRSGTDWSQRLAYLKASNAGVMDVFWWWCCYLW